MGPGAGVNREDGLPVLVIGGYLGSGKTTLLNRILAEASSRVAVVVNDFGSLGIDATLLQADANGLITLPNGCVCCSMADGFAIGMLGLRDRADEFDAVIIEASGVADPAKTAAFAKVPGFRLDGVIVLLDGERVRQLARSNYMSSTIDRHLASADLLLVTKGDLIGEQRAEAVATWARERAPQAKVIAAPATTVPVGALTAGLGAAGLGAAGQGVGQSARTLPEMDEGASHARHSTWTWEPGSLTREDLDAWFLSLPDSVVRAKGYVELDGQIHLIQGVGRRLEVTPARGDQRVGVVVIELA